jgi:hypothetical protein
MTAEQRNCQNCKDQFTIEPEDFDFYSKVQVPPPTWCPECRMVRRFLWRNERYLFRRKDIDTGEEVFSSFPAAVPAKIKELSSWNSESWDPMEYARDYDFSRPFLEQFHEFLYSVPWPSRSVLRMVNSDYCDQSGDMKNCYLCFGSGSMEDSAYSIAAQTVKDSLDLYQAHHTDLSYDSYMVDESYKVLYSVNCEECTDIWFSKDLLGCNNCFGCIGLRNKSYYIFNQPYSKEEYHKYLAQFDLGSHKTIMELKKKAHEIWLRYPVRYALVIKCTNSTGEHIEHSKNLKDCYAIHEGENMAYCQFMTPPISDSYDATRGWGSEQLYEVVTCGKECSGLKFCWECWPDCMDLEYSAFCRSSKHLFGCVGLKKKQFCIFNKQYSKAEYFALREKIISQMKEVPYKDKEGRVYGYGEFFPPSFSPFAYNESVAGDFFPANKKKVSALGSFLREPESKEFKISLDAKKLPDNISEVKDEIINEVIKCADCGKAYRIIQMELQFYRRIGLPLPRLCPTCRFKERFKLVNPPKFRKDICQCEGDRSKNGIYQNTDQAHPSHSKDEPCLKEFQTSIPLGGKEIVYCDECYNAEVS